MTKIDKLVRDRIPEIMSSKGQIFSERIMEMDEYLRRLQDKILEEAREVSVAQDEAELKEELADLLEVIYALIKAHQFNPQEIEELRVKKLQEKGGFDNRIYLA